MAEDAGTDTPKDEHTPIRIAEHGRARASIARAAAWGTMIGFAATAYIGHKGGIPFVDLVIRAILIGAFAGLAVRWTAQMIWKQIIFAELAAARREALETQKAILDELKDPSKIDDGQPRG